MQHEKWKYKKYYSQPYTIQWMNKFYHKKHKKYFEKLKNQTSHCPNQNTHCVFVSDFSSNCTQSTEFIETESIECQNSITEYIAENSSKEIKYKSKQEA